MGSTEQTKKESPENESSSSGAATTPSPDLPDAQPPSRRINLADHENQFYPGLRRAISIL